MSKNKKMRLADVVPVQSKTLLHLPDEVLVLIISKLGFFDRLNAKTTSEFILSVMILKEKPIHPVNNDREFKSVPLTAMGVGKMLHRMSLTSQMEWVFFFPVDFTVPLQVANLDILEKCLKKTNVLRISAIDQSHNAKHIIKFIDRSQYAGNLDIGGFIFKSGDFTKIYKATIKSSIVQLCIGDLSLEDCKVFARIVMGVSDKFFSRAPKKLLRTKRKEGVVSYTRSPCILVLVDGPWMTRITHRGNVYCISMKRIVSDNEASERTVIPRSGSK